MKLHRSFRICAGVFVWISYIYRKYWLAITVGIIKFRQLGTMLAYMAAISVGGIQIYGR